MKFFSYFAIISILAIEIIEARSAHDSVHSKRNQKAIKNKNVVNEDELNSEYWLNNAKAFVESQVAKNINLNKAKNIILFIGDGMSIPTLAATRAYMGGEEFKLSFETFPTTGMVKTYCVDYQVPDSACTATAYLTGIKGNYGTIGVSAKVPRKDCKAQLDNSTNSDSIAEWAIASGKSAGLVTTTRVTHASPAGVYASTADREWESDSQVKDAGCDPKKINDIAYQLVHKRGSKLKVIMGGGKKHFLHKEMNGTRDDPSVNLIKDWEGIHHKGKFVQNRQELLGLNLEEIDSILGLFNDDHMNYYLDTVHDKELYKYPTLAEMTDAAIDILSQNPNGFFLFVEGGRIDMGHHDSWARKALGETVQLSLAVELAREKLSENDTLIVVSSDHSHTMSYAGYSARHADVLGTGGMDDQEEAIPYLTLSYANGKGHAIHFKDGIRQNPDDMDLKDLSLNYPGTFPRNDETHGGDDVGVFASGPYSHLFSGTNEQHMIPHLMAYAACIGGGLKACDKPK